MLADLTVVDLGAGMAPALIAKFLAELGARVIRVEPPDGSLTRFGYVYRDGVFHIPEQVSIISFVEADGLTPPPVRFYRNALVRSGQRSGQWHSLVDVNGIGGCLHPHGRRSGQPVTPRLKNS